MKIQGPNPYVALYRKQQQAQKIKAEERPKDELNISNEALKLQQNEKIMERKQYVEEIKARVQSGNYKIEYDKTAEKMIDFWSKRI